VGAAESNSGANNSFFGHAAGKDFSGGNNNTLLGAERTAINGVQNARHWETRLPHSKATHSYGAVLTT
jgi:hypothetical protein